MIDIDIDDEAFVVDYGTDLPEGTAFVTPEGRIGVIGFPAPTTYQGRVLDGADMNALYAMSAAIREESANR